MQSTLRIKKYFKNKGQSKIITYNGYNVNGKNFILDNKKNLNL